MVIESIFISFFVFLLFPSVVIKSKVPPSKGFLWNNEDFLVAQEQN